MADNCFVLIPPQEPFSTYYREILTPAIRAAEFYPSRAEEIYGPGSIIDDIYKEIRESSALVADATGRNPDVTYELGMARALGLPVVIISQALEDIPFDYRNLRIVLYDTRKEGWETLLEERITNTLRKIKMSSRRTTVERRASVSHLEVNKVYMARPNIKIFLDLLRAADAKSEINLLGIALTCLIDARMQKAVESKLQEGCTVRLLSMHPKSKYIKHRAAAEGRSFAKFKKDVTLIDDYNKNFLKEHLAAFGERVQLGHYDEEPNYFIFMTSRAMIAGFYLSGSRGAFSPHIQLENREHSAYTAFGEHFDTLWKSRIETYSAHNSHREKLGLKKDTTHIDQPRTSRNRVFISYSRKDSKWLDRLLVHLRPLRREGLIDDWSDKRMEAGVSWREEIAKAIDSAAIALLLVSADFMASDFIANDELPPLLKRAAEGGAMIMPVIISPSRFGDTPSLAKYQAVNQPSKPLISLSRFEQEKTFLRVTHEIETALSRMQS